MRHYVGFVLAASALVACGSDPVSPPCCTLPDASTVDAKADATPSDAAADVGDASDAASDAADASDAGLVIGSDVRCAGGAGGSFLLVKGDPTYGTSDFCIAQFEMKDVNGTATSQPAGLPRVSVSRQVALQACQALGTGYDLPTNVQWQTMARALEGVATNWSGGAVGTGAMARGHSDAVPLAVLSVADEKDPCDQTGDVGCTAPGATFAQRRTHALPSGRWIWDVGGNAAEWIKDDVTASAFYSGYAGKTTGATATAYGPSGAYTVGALPEVSSSYPTNVRVNAGSLATVSGQNFSSGSIWVRSGGVVLVRGSNYSGNLYLEPAASFVNLGSNILDPATRVKSSASFLHGSFGSSSTTADVDYSNCGGSCPQGTTTFTADESRGLGYTYVFTSTLAGTRGGQVGFGPLAGVFTTIEAAAPSAYVGFRCVKPAN